MGLKSAHTATLAARGGEEGSLRRRSSAPNAVMQLAFHHLRIGDTVDEVLLSEERKALHGACAASLQVSDLLCNIRREAGQSLVIGGSSLVILEGNACHPL